MQTVILEFPSEREMEEAIRHLWEKVGVTGEMLSQRLQDDCWRLEVVSEQGLRPAVVEKAGGRVVQS